MTQPAPTSSPKSGIPPIAEWASHQWVVATATVLTIVTGVAFIINAIFAEDETLDVAALAAALAAAQLQASELADGELSDVPDGQQEQIAQIQQELEEQKRALSAFAAQAETSSQSKEEQERITAALIRYASGSSDDVLEILAEVAEAQMIRGEREAAAQTWSHRASLQAFSAPQQATIDLQLACDLVPGDVRKRMRLASFYAASRDFPRAIQCMETALVASVEQADRELEFEVLTGLYHLLSQHLTIQQAIASGDDAVSTESIDSFGLSDPEFAPVARRRRAVSLQIALLLPQLQSEASADMENLRRFAEAFPAVYSGLVTDNPAAAEDSLAEIDAMRADIYGQVDFDLPDMDAVELYCLLSSGRSAAMAAAGRNDALAEIFDEVLQMESLFATASGVTPEQAQDSFKRTYLAAGMMHFLGHPERAVPGLDLALSISERAPFERVREDKLFALAITSDALKALGREQDGLAYRKQVLDVYAQMDQNSHSSETSYLIARDSMIFVAWHTIGSDRAAAAQHVSSARELHDAQFAGADPEVDKGLARLTELEAALQESTD